MVLEAVILAVGIQRDERKEDAYEAHDGYGYQHSIVYHSTIAREETSGEEVYEYRAFAALDTLLFGLALLLFLFILL